MVRGNQAAYRRHGRLRQWSRNLEGRNDGPSARARLHHRLHDRQRGKSRRRREDGPGQPLHFEHPGLRSKDGLKRKTLRRMARFNELANAPFRCSMTTASPRQSKLLAYLHCATFRTAVRSLMELFDGRFLAASSAAAQAAVGSPFWNLAQARLVQASLKSGDSLTAWSSTSCASRGRLAIRSKRP